MSFLKGYRGSLGDRQQRLVLLYLLVLLVPNFVLIRTEPYSVPTSLATVLIAAGFYLGLVSFSRKTGVMVLASLPFIILCAFQLVITYLFGNSIIAVDMFTNVFTTSTSEAGELLASLYPSVILVCVLYIPLLVAAVRSVVRKQKISPELRKTNLKMSGVLVLSGAVFAGISEYRNSDFALRYHAFPFNVCYNIGVSVERWNRTMNYHETSADFSFGAVKEPGEGREIYVLVIGEASRAANWSLYGYDRPTNPRLSQKDGLHVFRDVTTESNTTHKSVPIMLSAVSATNFEDVYRQKGICTLFSEAGFRTAFISNQPANRSLTQFFAHQADTLIDLTVAPLMITEEHHDEHILPHLRNIVSESGDNLFVVIHTYGSHATHSKRYPESAAVFTPDKSQSVNKKYRDRLVNAYDNSILYTDHVVSEIIDVLGQTAASSAMLFCSDHGEDLMDDRRGRFLHASPTTTYYQLHVPMLLWFSDAYTEARPWVVSTAAEHSDAPATTSAVFHTISDIAGIESRYTDRSRSLVHPSWKARPRMYITDHNKAVNFINTGLEHYDFELMDRAGMDYDPALLDDRRY